MPDVLAPSVVPCPVALLRTAEVAHPERAIARGELVPVRRGVFASAEEWRALPPWDRYLARVHAVWLQAPDAVFCLESAAALSGMAVLGDPGIVHVLSLDGSGASRLVAGVRTHTGALERDITDLDGMLMTAYADTAVDIARMRHPAVGLATADAARRYVPGLSAEVLTAMNESRVSSRGRRNARWPLENADPDAETVLESVSRAVIHWLGFPAPVLQHTFVTPGEPDDRSDFLWPDVRMVGEADGDIKYDGRFGDPIAALRRRRERDARLLRQVRNVTHWGWFEATAVTPLRGILLGAGLPHLGVEHTAQLHSLRRLLAPRSAA